VRDRLERRPPKIGEEGEARQPLDDVRVVHLAAAA
jgi:hypothetical protein